MFNNIGAKIKGLAKFIFWVTCIASVIGGIVMAIQGISNTYSDNTEKIMSVVYGVGIAVGGTILAWLENFLLYGYGELVDSNQKILKILEQNNTKEQKNE